MARVRTRLRALVAFLLSKPIPVTIKGGAFSTSAHFFPSAGLVLPVVAGADGDGDGDGTDDGDGDGDAGDGDDGDAGKDAGDDGDGDGDEGTEPPKPKESNWKAESRKHERRAKQSAKELEDLRKKLKEREDEDKSEQEKAVEKAREEGRTEALTKAEKERRSDRLEVAVTRLAAKPITLGEGDKAEKVRFADPEDAQIYIERKIRKGDLDEDEVFDGEGKVRTEVIQEALQEILAERRHLAADDKPAKPSGDADAGKGSAQKTELEDMSPEELHKLKKKGQ